MLARVADRANGRWFPDRQAVTGPSLSLIAFATDPINADFGTIAGSIDVGFADIFAQAASDIGLSS